MYEVTVTASDRRGGTDDRNVRITVTNVNESPDITGGPSSPDYPENRATSVGRYSATDPDGDDISWSLSGADDDDLSISSSGVLTFDDPPDFESPADSGRNNVYEVTVTASDRRGGTDDRNVTIRVRNLDPTIQSGLYSKTYDEGEGSPVSTYTASDPGGGDINWLLSGADDDDLSISSSGVLTFDDPPDFENPADSGRNNVYEVTVTASDGRGGTDDRNVRITVTNVNESPRVVSAIADRTMTAGASTTISLSGRFSDPDGDALIYTAHSLIPSVATASVSGDTLTLTAVSAGLTTITVTAADKAPGQSGRLSVAAVFAVTVEVLPPAIPTNLATTTGDGTITLDWDDAAHATSYEVQQWDGTTGNVTWRTLPFDSFTLNGSSGSVTITDSMATVGGLTNGASYSHRVRSVNSADESMWTTGVVTHLPLAKPGMLDVEPLALRKARLKWAAVANADKYVVEIRKVGKTSWTAQPATTSVYYEIDLDDILGGDGLADAPYAYEFHVKATKSGGSHNDSAYSDIIRIKDNPLLLDGGQAYAVSSDEALLKWTVDASATNYEIRYRKLGYYTAFGIGNKDHTNLDWPKGATWPYYHGTETEAPDTPGNQTIDDLDEGEIYAFQINYEIGDTKVFSARDAYVWPSSVKPGDDGRVATYPFFGHHASRKFEYIICQNGFPAGQQAQWTELIEDALGQWQEATSGFITMVPTAMNCVTGTGTNPIAVFIQDDDDRNEVRMLDVPAPAALHSSWEFKSDVFKFCLEEAAACVTSFTGYSNLRTQDPAERVRFADLVKKARDQDLGLSPALLEFLLDIKEAAGNTREASNVLQGVDVTFKHGSFPRGPNIPSSSHPPAHPNPDPGKVRFNTCLNSGTPDRNDNLRGHRFFAFATAVHEAGHALGLSNFSYYDLLTEGFWEAILGILDVLTSTPLPLPPFLQSLLVTIEDLLETVGLAEDKNYQPWKWHTQLFRTL